MMNTEKIVDLGAVRAQKAANDAAADKAINRAARKHKLLCFADRVWHHTKLSLAAIACGLGRCGIRLGRKVFRLIANVGIAVCLFLALRDFINHFPSPVFAGYLLGALALQIVKLTIDRLLTQAQPGSVFDVVPPSHKTR